jgi:N-acetylglutamate synthase-like GNAT family acetyltransferase
MRASVTLVDDDGLLAAYDSDLREGSELLGARWTRREQPVWWAGFDHGGFVTYRDLGGLTGSDLDAVIGRTVAFFRDETDVAQFEWKTRGHDRPADLGERLVAQGLAAEDEETVMVGEAVRLLDAPPPPQGVAVRRVGDGADLHDDVAAVLRMQEEVFGVDRGPRLEAVLSAAREGSEEYWLAEAGDLVVATGSLRPVPGTRFAGIWGGAVREGWRGRGIYRALVAARARAAIARGVELVHSDSTAMSRPILERSGLVAVTTTTPYVWRPG